MSKLQWPNWKMAPKTTPFPHALLLLLLPLETGEATCKRKKAPVCHDPINTTRPDRRPNAEHLTPFQPTFLHRHEVSSRPRKPPPTVQQWQDCWCPNPTKTQSPRPYHYPGKIRSKSHARSPITGRGRTKDRGGEKKKHREKKRSLRGTGDFNFRLLPLA
jgi:hypothetical protein